MAILAYCKHINIAKIRAIYFDPKNIQVNIIQPRYCIDLYSALFDKKKKLIIPYKKIISCQILQALKYIHDAGLVHLDLKPANIMFKTQELDEIVLLDFGISNIYKGNESAKILGMSPPYCPPEVTFTSSSQISPKADIFSFGIILYEIYTQRRAFQNLENKEIYNLIREENFQFFDKHSLTGNAEIDNFIRNCVNREATERPTSDQALEIMQKMQID